MNKPCKDSVLILLGAGKPHQGTIHSSLNQTPDSRLVLDWTIEAFSGTEVEIYFVGGYNIKEIQRIY